MTLDALDERKAALRTRAKAIRAAIPASVRDAAGAAVAARFLAAFTPRAGTIVAAYWPIRDELDCRPLMARLRHAGCRLCLPATDGESPLLMRLWDGETPLAPSGFGTRAPGGDAPAVVPDIVLAPLLAYDGRGTRLGYGRGHYDRAIAGMTPRPLLVGLAFAAQHVDRLPAAPHDVRLDAVVTEAGVERFAGTASR